MRTLLLIIFIAAQRYCVRGIAMTGYGIRRALGSMPPLMAFRGEYTPVILSAAKDPRRSRSTKGERRCGQHRFAQDDERLMRRNVIKET